VSQEVQRPDTGRARECDQSGPCGKGGHRSVVVLVCHRRWLTAEQLPSFHLTTTHSSASFISLPAISYPLSTLPLSAFHNCCGLSHTYNSTCPPKLTTSRLSSTNSPKPTSNFSLLSLKLKPPLPIHSITSSRDSNSKGPYKYLHSKTPSRLSVATHPFTLRAPFLPTQPSPITTSLHPNIHTDTLHQIILCLLT